MGILLEEFRRGAHTCLTAVHASPGEPTYLIDLFYGKDNVFSKGSGYENPELVQLISQSYAYSDEKDLKPIFDKMLKLLARDSPHIWLGFPYATNLWRDAVQGFAVNQGLTMRVQTASKA
jgi:ABC-type transport system substrate-binding protein